jgi:hypothetical protein
MCVTQISCYIDSSQSYLRIHIIAVGLGTYVLAVDMGALLYIQGVPGGKVNILGGHSICHSKQKCLYEHLSYSEQFPR